MYDNYTVKELEAIIKNKKEELIDLEFSLMSARIREHKEKYETVRVEGCEGCDLENYPWNHTCDHCDGTHLEERLRRN